jgi:hypothetical protein
MLQQGIMLLTRFCQDDRVQVPQPRRNLQIKFNRPLTGKNDFVAYIDAIGKLDGRRCLLEWKTSSCRYPEEPAGLLSLDPQLVCYSWITGIADVAQVVFVRKRLVEVQYLKTMGCTDAAAVRHLLTATELSRPCAEILELKGLERYERPLPLMNEYDQLLSLAASTAEVAR